MITILSCFYKKEQIIYIKSNATHNLVSRQRADVTIYIEHLVKENRIRVEDIHMVKYLETSFSISSLKKEHEKVSLFQEIDEIEYFKIKEKVTEIAELNGFSYKEYVQAANKLIKIDYKVKKMLNEVKEYYIENDYDYIFLTKNITILQPESVQSVTREEARKAFENKLIKLTNNRMKKEQYNNRTQYTKEFYRLAMFVTLRKLKVEGLDEVIDEEIAQIPLKCDEMYKKYHNIKPTFEEIEAKHNNSSLSLEQVEQIEDIFEPSYEVKETKTNEQPVEEVIEFAKPVSEVELRERKEVNREIVSKTKNREDDLDVLWEKWEADDAKEAA